MDAAKFYVECNGDLVATAKKMASPDYQDRMEAEYAQARIRLNRLCDMLTAWENGELDFEPKCPRELLDAQMGALGSYVAILQARENYENR